MVWNPRSSVRGAFGMTPGIDDGFAAKNTVILQDAIDQSVAGDIVLIPTDTFTLNQILMPSGITIEGQGATLVPNSTMGVNTQFFLNETVYSYNETDIAFRNLIFDGNAIGYGLTQTRLAALVSMNHVTKLNFENVRFTNIQGIGCEIGGCHDVVVDRCRFDNCGYEGAAVETTLTVDNDSGGPAPTTADISSYDWEGAGFEVGASLKLFSGDNNNAVPCTVTSIDGTTMSLLSSGNVLYPSVGAVAMRIQSFSDSAGAPLRCARGSAGDCEQVRIINNNFVDNQWSSHLSIVDSVVDGNCFTNSGEGHLFLAHHYDGVTKMQDSVISNNVFDTTFVRNISGSGMEVSGINLTFTGNRVQNCQQPGLSLGAPDNCTVIGNSFSNCGLQVGATLWPGIRVYDEVTSEPIKNTLIEANYFYDDQDTPTTDHSILVEGVQPAENLVLKGNMEGAGLVVGGIHRITSGSFPWNDSCKVINHITATSVSNSIKPVIRDGQPVFYDDEPVEYNQWP